MAIGAARVVRQQPGGGAVSYRELFRFGLPLYPGSFTLFFSYRADVYLLALLVPDAAVALGFYTVAVTLAELVFFLPDAVSTLFFPRVAGSLREDADREVPRVARVTLLLTAGSAAILAPAATVLILVVLPAFTSSLPVLYVLLPAVVTLGVQKVLMGYLAGLGRTGAMSLMNIASFGINVVANLLLIPPFGIVGAALASLLSYSISSFAFTAVAGRLTGRHVLSFWTPRVSDVRFVLDAIVALWRRASRRTGASPRVS
jgi:O-antigen/teichoic acid export membrane protein